MPTINKQSVRLLTKTFIKASFDTGHSVNDSPLFKQCITILKNYIGTDDKADLQVECLYAVQLLVNELEHPSGESTLLKKMNNLSFLLISFTNIQVY